MRLLTACFFFPKKRPFGVYDDFISWRSAFFEKFSWLYLVSFLGLNLPGTPFQTQPSCVRLRSLEGPIRQEFDSIELHLEVVPSFGSRFFRQLRSSCSR